MFADAPNIAARVQAAAEPWLGAYHPERSAPGSALFVAEELDARRTQRRVSTQYRLFRIIRASGGRRNGAGRQALFSSGREDETRSVSAGAGSGARDGAGQLALIVGEPGIGKSRLVEVFQTQPRTLGEYAAHL